ncbi:hypothetical protein CC85DRAFT_30188 [Cutaneotrichosporon oleaginosum]|uniref:Xylanolytic transcriptional activator regulatory domain-containing protein n=1 Tax=Cutaneotrichosporon oleaginosum TaxID=879819 RepID=A0A0J0XSP9_9TREE|nr:uncharacterized protein CC85DRAFT_30188 [Cutaneotrichosporon oleaginosum]KLT44093.1 hypothetical protein CC85DRAFT_30188 [Cutaneotrichosporon oleaginosum]TXT09452.1 hypothetical protein COLE_03386 [Cutaneotrichosporon oleaginosum]
MFIPDMLDNKAGDWGQPRHAPMPISKHSPDLYSLSSGSDTRPSPLAQYGLLPGKNSATFEDYLSPPLQIIDGPQAAFHGRNADEDAPPVSAEALSETYSNPIEMGYMTETYARNLFALFITRVAPSSSLFDPYYHTLERVRQSPVLFTAVLSAAALFMRPELADSLRKLADEHINRMISSGYYDLSLIQAILVLVNWKHPNDRTAYQKMGMAVRLVQELRLARIATSPNASESPKNSNEQRRKVDIERTVQWCFGVWLVGTSLTTGHDIALSYALQLPPAQFSPMPTADQVNRWAESHRHLNVHGDFFLAFNAGYAACFNPRSPKLVGGPLLVRRSPPLFDRGNTSEVYDGVL